MPNPTIGVVITGKSNIDQVLAVTSKQMQAFRRQSEASSRQIQKMSESSGISALSKGFKGLSDQSFQLYQNLGRSVDQLGFLTGATSIGGIVALSRSLATLGQSQLNASRGINMGATQLIGWQNATKAAGASAADATSSITEMEKARARMATGLDQQGMGIASQALGSDWLSKYKDDHSLILAMSDKLSHLQGQYKAEAMSQLEGAFHISSGFANFLSQGPGYVESAYKKGLASAPNAGQLSNLNQLATSFSDLENSITGAAEAGASAIAPKLIPALNSMSSWIDSHQKSFDLFATTLGAIGTGLGFKALKGLLGGGKPPTGPISGGASAPNVRPATSSVPGVSSLPEDVAPSLWSRLLPVGAGVSELTLGALTGAAIALWPETPGKDDLGMGRKSIASQGGNAAIFASMARAQGFDNNAISGMLGSLSWESQLNPNASNNIGGGHYGIAQWSQERQALFKQVEGVDIHQSTFAQQADFLLREEKNAYPKTWNGLHSGNDVQTDAKLFSDDYERPGNDGSIIHRTAYAQQWASLLDQTSPDSSADDQALHNKADAVSAADPEDDPHVTVDVNIKHDGTVVTRQRQSGPGVTARVRTATAMPMAGGLY